jgi:hypothetical protein
MNNEMDNKHIFEFGHLVVFDSYAVITCNETVNIDFDEISEIEAVLHSFYLERPFGLIANRENFYSVNPLAIDKLFSRDNLVAGAIVGKAIKHAINAAFENTFVGGATIKYFFDLAPAIAWIEETVREKRHIH